MGACMTARLLWCQVLYGAQGQLLNSAYSVSPEQLTTSKRILVWGSRIICNLYASTLTHRIVVEVDI